MIPTNPFESRLIGHKKTWEHLQALSKLGRLPHALLFCGPPSVGKRLAAFALAADLLQRNKTSTGSIEQILISGSHPDLHVIQREEEKKDIAVEAIRELRANLQLQPFMGKAAVAVIDNAHEMTIAASNALLLTLEEPAAGRYLFLISHAPQRLPDTIVSRCQTVFFGELNTTEVASILRRFFPEKLDEQTLATILTLTGPSLAATGLEQFVNFRTLGIENATQAWKALAELAARSEGISESLRRVLSEEKLVDGGAGALAGDCLSLASLLSEDKADALSWLVLRNTLRSLLRKGGASQAYRNADLLLQALEAERLIKDRNANPQLQLSSLFLSSSENSLIS